MRCVPGLGLQDGFSEDLIRRVQIAIVQGDSKSQGVEITREIP